MSKLLKKYAFAVLAALAAVGFASLNFSGSNEKSDPDTLTVGLQSGYPPFEYRDENGDIVGFDIDVSEKIAAKLGKKLVVKDMEFDGEILSLKQGKIDLIVSGMNITPSREKEILMVPYHGDTATSLSLVFWENVPQGIGSIEDLIKLSNPVVSVGAGTTAETYLNHYQTIQAKSFDGSLACLMDVKYGKSVATLVESDVAEYLEQEHPEVKVIEVPLAQDESLAGFGIGIHKKNEPLFQKVRKVIEELKASGEMKELEDKWFKEGKS